MTRAESIRAMHPLFQTDQGGSIPTSALDLWFCTIDRLLADDLCRLWHSTLPDTGGGGQRVCYGATFGNMFYAAAIWTNPSSPKLPQLEWIQLSRFAIADDSVKNHASRMLLDAQGHSEEIPKEGDEQVRKGTMWTNRMRDNQVEGKPEIVKRWLRTIVGPSNYTPRKS